MGILKVSKSQKHFFLETPLPPQKCTKYLTMEFQEKNAFEIYWPLLGMQFFYNIKILTWSCGEKQPKYIWEETSNTVIERSMINFVKCTQRKILSFMYPITLLRYWGVICIFFLILCLFQILKVIQFSKYLDLSLMQKIHLENIDVLTRNQDYQN